MTRRLDTTTFAAVGATCALRVAAAPLELVPARHARGAALAEVTACEHALTRFQPTSDLRRANAAAGRWVEVDPRLVEALAEALVLRDETAGRCDPAASAPGVIELDRRRSAVRLARGVALDLGATAKGWIAARALAATRRAWPGLPGALIDLGGDLAFVGEPPGGGPWLVDVEDPRDPAGVLGTIRVRSGGVATSGPTRRRFHLIDAATRAPFSGGPLAATAVAADPAAADAHATALAVLPVADAAAYVSARPGLGAVVVPAEGAPLVLGELDYVPAEQAAA